MPIASFLRVFLASLLLCGTATMSHAGDGHEKIQLTEPWARASAGPAKNGAAYITITNHGTEADRLIGLRSEAAARNELHTHIMENDVAKMRPVEAIEIPAGASVKLMPGGDHIMFMGLHDSLKEGESVTITLIFEKAGEVGILVPIAGVGAQAPEGGGHDHDDHDHDNHDHGDHDHSDHSN
ncbi:MAG: copper chaperone PCu(A)C [Pseudomonadota bacterium]